jgi:signal peptidase II
VEVVLDVWEYRYVENPGAAWGFLSQTKSRLRTPFFIVVTVVAMAFILIYFYSTSLHQTLLRTALALVFGGAIGNFIDRVRLGYVIDFIHWHWRNSFSWPTFNIADSAITVGVVFMALDLFLSRPESARG